MVKIGICTCAFELFMSYGQKKILTFQIHKGENQKEPFVSKTKSARAGWPRRLALVRATSRAEVDVIVSFNDVESPGQPFHARHFLDPIAPSPSYITAPTCIYRLLSRLLTSIYNRWMHLDTVSRRIFGDIHQTQFLGSEMEVHITWKTGHPVSFCHSVLFYMGI